MSTILPAILVKEYRFAEDEGGFRVRVLLSALVSLLLRRSLLSFNVPPQDLRVEDIVPHRVPLGLFVLVEGAPSFSFTHGQIHFLQNLRASRDLTT